MPWFGAKRNLAPRIVEMFPKHSAYWEIFCGSLAVLFEKGPCSMETVNDKHGDLINLCNVLRVEATAVELYSRLSRLVFHEDLFHHEAELYRQRGQSPAPDDPSVDRAENFMICSWFGRNGAAGTQSYNQGFCMRYTKNGGHAAKRWHSAVESIPDWHERLRNVTCVNRDAFELLDRIEDSEGVVIYADPPYLTKGAKYIHDFSEQDHDRLAESLSRFKHTTVLVSYYEHERLELTPSENRKQIRSETYRGIGEAMANQWGSLT